MDAYFKDFDKVNYHLVTLKCAMVDIDAKHGISKRSTTGETITKLADSIIKLVEKAEKVVDNNDWNDMPLQVEGQYLIDLANRCRWVLTTRQRKQIVSILETIKAALASQLAAVIEIKSKAVEIETVETTEVKELETIEVSDIIFNEVIYSLALITYYSIKKVNGVCQSKSTQRTHRMRKQLQNATLMLWLIDMYDHLIQKHLETQLRYFVNQSRITHFWNVKKTPTETLLLLSRMQ